MKASVVVRERRYGDKIVRIELDGDKSLVEHFIKSIDKIVEGEQWVIS